MLTFLLAAPGPLRDVRVADVDGDGTAELVLATASGPDPSAVVLTVVDVGASGEQQRAAVQLPAEASWWDAGHGIWLRDGAGLTERLTGRTLTALTSPLAWMGPTTPAQSPMVTDLDGDDIAELMIWGPAGLAVLGEHGASWGHVAVTGSGALSAERDQGGAAQRISLVSPPVVTGDVDGDGAQDIIVVEASRLVVHRTLPGQVSASQQRWPLPAVLRPPSGERSNEEDHVTDVHWKDLTGDGLLDLLVHRIHSDGRLAGTEAEVHLLVGTGTGLGPAQILRTGAGSQDVFPIDLDGDGDLDVLIPQVSLDVGNLAQAVMSRSVEVELTALEMKDGRLAAPVTLLTVDVSLEGETSAWSLFEDLSGDGLPDLAVVHGGTLRCHRGQGMSVQARPWVSAPVSVPVEHLWGADLDGDGRAELVGWAPGARQLVVARLP